MIEKYSFGNLTYNRINYTSDIIIFGNEVIDNWWRRDGHELCIADIQGFIEKFNPSIIVVGTGKFGVLKILPETESFLESLQIKLIACNTDKACDRFNSLSNNKGLLAALHLTC